MTLKTDIDQIAVDAGKLHDIVHGGSTAVVATDGGTVKSVAKAIADLEVQIVTEAGSYVDLCQDEVALATAQAQTATNQAAAAAGSALSAASVVAQDLSAIDRTVFASTTLVDVFLYDTSKDSDGGAWRKRCAHTSWENETLSGNWLGSAANEAAARAISGAVTGSYYYDTTAAVFYKLNAGSGVTQVYRGNVRQFPAQVLITAGTDRVILWDLTQAGVPMWMVFKRVANYLIHSGNSTGVAMRNGVLAASSTTQTTALSFVSEAGWLKTAQYSYTSSLNIANRNTVGVLTITSATPLVNGTCNAVAMTVLPNAPVDVASGLTIPTIAVATAGGVSVIKDDGNVWDIVPDGGAAYSYAVSFTPDHRIMFENDGTGTRRTTRVNAIPTADVTHVYTTKSTSLEAYTNGQTFAGDLTYLGGATSLKAIPKAIGTELALNVMRRNPGAPASGMIAYVTKDYNSGWQVGAIKGAWLADTVAETLTGTELVTNGTFATDITGWSNYGSGTNSWDASGAIKVLNDASGAQQAIAGQPITCVAGKTYVVSADLTGSSGVTGYIQVGTASSNASTANVPASGGAGAKFLFSFVATQTTHYLRLANGNTTANAYQIFDNVSIRLADVDRSVKAKGLQAFGSLTKAAVASGAQLMGYSGFSAANYLEQPYNSDLDFGTGDFCVMGWMYKTSDGNCHVISRCSTSGGLSGFWWGADSGLWRFQTYEASNLTRVSMAALPASNTWNFFGLVRSGTNMYVYTNGQLSDSASGTVRNVSGTSPVMRVGVEATGVTIPAAQVTAALWRVTTTVPSAEQIKHIYETEKGLFEANAQCCLAGTSNAVTALAYDDETDLLHVGTSYGRSAFKGLVRVASEATPVGAIVALAAGAGVIAQAGATAVDVYVPAYSLREELLRDAEQMARFGQNLIAHDFTATASQTNFALPVGWEIVAVYQQGALKRETTSWTRSFDGFVWSAVLGTGATVSDWISILAKRV